MPAAILDVDGTVAVLTADLHDRLDETPLPDRYFLRFTAASNCRLFMLERPLTFRRFAWL